MYTWNGMKKISFREAKERFNDDKLVFLLYNDGTEAEAVSMDDMVKHLNNYGEFGVERITEVDKLLKQLASLLPNIYDSYVDDDFKATHFLTNADGTEILSTEESEVEALANLFDQLYGVGTVNTGYYDPEEDKRNNEVDAYTGLYYVTIN